MKERRVTFAMDEEEYKQYMQAYRNMLIAGKCVNKSDFLRQAVLAFSHNGQDSKLRGELKEAVLIDDKAFEDDEPDSEPDTKPNKFNWDAL